MTGAHRSVEEIANAATHGIGIAASVVATVILVVMAALDGTALHIVSSAVFGTTLILLYTASTLYHAACGEQARARLRVLDHAAIYLLIAGTYTPFTLVGLRGGWGWSLFGVVWALAAAGVVFKLFSTGRLRRLSTGLYLCMGWLGIVAAGPMVARLDAGTLLWLLVGGLLYTAGTAFYHSRRIPYAHAVWHLFVLGGSLCHVIAVGTQMRPL